MRNKKFNLLLSLIMLLSLFTLTSPMKSSANQSLEDVRRQIQELEKDIEGVQSERENINRDISNAKNELEKNKQQQSQTQNDIEQIEQNLQNTQNQIDAKRTEISQKENEITEVEGEIKELEKEIERLEENIVQLHKDIKEKEEKIEQREELLKDRLRTLQRNGGNIAYVDVILGAQDFGDFITRTTAVNKIMDQDKKIMEDFFEDKLILEDYKTELEETKILVTKNKEDLDEKRDTLETQREQLVAERSNLEALENQLAQQKTEKDNLLAQLQEEEQYIAEYKLSAEEEARILRNQQASFETLLAQYKEQEKALQQTSANKPPAAGNSTFMRPASTAVSSEFGMRWGRMHYGIDLRGPRGVPVVASAPGVVSTVVTGCSEGNRWCGGGYGNYIIVTHLINGEQYVTLYAHLNSVNVSRGQVVNQGQQIGTIGHTGDSTGPHLHFEIHEGQWNGAKSNAVNPRKYINF